jgi:hypothetical protein
MLSAEGMEGIVNAFLAVEYLAAQDLTSHSCKHNWKSWIHAGRKGEE